VTEIAHVRSKDTQFSTFNAGIDELLNEAGAEIDTEAGVVLLSESTADWVVSIAHVKSEDMAHVRIPEVYSAALVDFLDNEAGVDILAETGVEILSENLSTTYIVELTHV